MLPPFYGREKLVGLPRDPWWAWLYWELSPKRAGELREILSQGRCQAEVRLLLSASKRPVSSSSCDLAAGKTLLKAPAAGETYFAELGIQRPGRPFTVLLRSEPFTCPRGEPSGTASREELGLPPDLEHFRPPRKT